MRVQYWTEVCKCLLDETDINSFTLIRKHVEARVIYNQTSYGDFEKDADKYFAGVEELKQDLSIAEFNLKAEKWEAEKFEEQQKTFKEYRDNIAKATDNAEERLVKERDRVEKLQEGLEQVKGVVDKLKKEQAALATEKDQLNKRNGEQSTAIADLTTEVNEAKSRVTSFVSLQTQFEERRQAYEKLIEENENSKKELRNAQARVASLSAELAELRGGATQKDAEVQHLEIERQSLNADLSKANTENEQRKTRIVDLETSLKEKDATIAGKDTTIQGRDNTIREQTAELNGIRPKAERLEKVQQNLTETNLKLGEITAERDSLSNISQQYDVSKKQVNAWQEIFFSGVLQKSRDNWTGTEVELPVLKVLEDVSEIPAPSQITLIRPFETCSKPVVAALRIWYDLANDEVGLSHVVQLLHNLPIGRSLSICVALVKDGLEDMMPTTIEHFLLRNFIKQYAGLEPAQPQSLIMQALESDDIRATLLDFEKFEVGGYTFIVDQPWLIVIRDKVWLLNEKEYALEEEFPGYNLLFNIDGKTEKVMLETLTDVDSARVYQMTDALARMAVGNPDFEIYQQVVA